MFESSSLASGQATRRRTAGLKRFDNYREVEAERKTRSMAGPSGQALKDVVFRWWDAVVVAEVYQDSEPRKESLVLATAMVRVHG